MNKTLLIPIILAVLILSGCKNQTQVNNENEKQFNYQLNFGEKPFRIGTTGFFPQNGFEANLEQIENFWQETQLISDLYGVHTDWKQTSIIDNSIKNTELDIVLGLGFQEPDEWESQVENYIKKASQILKNERIKYLFWGNEVNILANKHPEKFPKFLEVSKKIYTELKKEFPELKIIFTFQYEILIGKGYLSTGKKSSTSNTELIKQFEPISDIIGFTTYPMFDYTDPDDIPANYYSQIQNFTNKPIVFTEFGWLSKTKFPPAIKQLEEQGYAGSENEQAAFLLKFIELTKDVDLEFANWIAMHDIRDWESLPEETAVDDKMIFDSIGLKYFDSREKKIWNIFGSIQNLPLAQ